MKTIKWRVVQVDITKIKPTPGNYKLRTDESYNRFITSVDNYGLAGAVVLNADFTLIDGNSRWEKAKQIGIKKIDASMPNRLLTPKEFKEFSAIFDLAVAGEVDLKRITEELGTTEAFFKRWGLDMPKVALNKLTELEKNEKVINPTQTRKIPDSAKEITTRPVTLIFTTVEAVEFLRCAEKLYSKYKVDNVTDLCFALIKKG